MNRLLCTLLAMLLALGLAPGLASAGERAQAPVTISGNAAWGSVLDARLGSNEQVIGCNFGEVDGRRYVACLARDTHNVQISCALPLSDNPRFERLIAAIRPGSYVYFNSDGNHCRSLTVNNHSQYY